MEKLDLKKSRKESVCNYGWNEKHVTPMLIWFSSSIKPTVASFRYRALLPIAALESEGISNLATDNPSVIQLTSEVDAIIFVKNFSQAALNIAWKAHERQIPIILDLCDNIFVPGYGQGFDGFLLVSNFLSMARIATAVVTTTEPMQQLIQQHIGTKIPVFIVPDGIESEEFITKILRKKSPKLQLKPTDQSMGDNSLPTGKPIKITLSEEPRLKRYLRKVKYAIQDPQKAIRVIRQSIPGRFLLIPIKHLVRAWVTWNKRFRPGKLSTEHSESLKSATERKPIATIKDIVETIASEPLEQTVLWFGNAGTPYGDFGIPTLLRIEHALASINREIPLRLVVISNNREKYDEYIRPMLITTKYIEWDPIAIYAHIRKASVVVLPNSLDAFSIGKSANRAVLALSLGTPVIATSIPSMEPLRSVVVLDDWMGGLRKYLLNNAARDQDIANGRTLIQCLYGETAIASAWKAVLTATRSADLRQRDRGRIRLLVFLDLMQDVDLALPILQAAIRDDRFAPRVAVTRALIARSPRSQLLIESLGLDLRIYERSDIITGSTPNLSEIDRLVTISETNLPPHRAGRTLTERAKSLQIPTFTLQHGMENVGLNYFGEQTDVNFASDHILTWGTRSILPDRTPSDIQKRCSVIGLVKPSTVSAVSHLPGLAGQSRIGIFENLHWDRYDNNYRNAFLVDMLLTAKTHPNIQFLVKPHHAGRWLTGRFNGQLVIPKNMLFLDPKDPEWEPFTAPAIIANCNAIITTPSTVALDAARTGKSVAVTCYNTNLPFYAPLSLLSSATDWSQFIEQALNNAVDLSDKSRTFVTAVVANGDACTKALELIYRNQSIKSN